MIQHQGLPCTKSAGFRFDVSSVAPGLRFSAVDVKTAFTGCAMPSVLSEFRLDA